jgi:hypothetical protein
VLEFVEGQTLADRIARGPMSVDEALAFAVQVRTKAHAGIQQYAVSADRNRFLMNVVTREQTISPITVVLNRR